MKALIVDDEQHVREAIQMLVDWESYGIVEIMEASDGGAAIEVIRAANPEIIFTDMMMPGVGGCELLSWIQENAPCSKTIVISGHDDFQLVRHSMTTGGIDYILKPIDPDELEKAVAQAVSLWKEESVSRREQQSRNIEINAIKPIYWEKIFTELIQHSDKEGKKLSDIRREFPDLAAATQCHCSIISLRDLDPYIETKYNSHRDLLFFSLTNISNEFLQAARTSRSGFAFRCWSSEDEIVLLQWNGLTQLHEQMDRLNQAFRDTLGARFDIGISTIRDFPLEVHHVYREARAALQQRNVVANESRIYTFGESSESRMTEERNIIAEIQQYMEANYHTDLTLQHIASTFYLSREYVSRRFKQKAGVNLSEYLEQIRIDKAKIYLKDHDVRISQVAAMVGYQDDKYFSRVFKKLTGCTPKDYRQTHQE
jgi:YesN/AraC family two-component response regulator